jgi:hypothetical protein
MCIVGHGCMNRFLFQCIFVIKWHIKLEITTYLYDLMNDVTMAMSEQTPNNYVQSCLLGCTAV